MVFEWAGQPQTTGMKGWGGDLNERFAADLRSNFSLRFSEVVLTGSGPNNTLYDDVTTRVYV